MRKRPQQPLFAEAGSASDRAARLARFRGPLAERDAETVAYWREASPAAHAAAMIQLAEMAEMIVAHTRFTKDPNEMFPGFPELRRFDSSGGDTSS